MASGNQQRRRRPLALGPSMSGISTAMFWMSVGYLLGGVGGGGDVGGWGRTVCEDGG